MGTIENAYRSYGADPRTGCLAVLWPDLHVSLTGGLSKSYK